MIVLDEPDAHLDERGTAALVGALATLKKAGAIVVVTTHRPALMKVIDQLMTLNDGIVEMFGPTPEVLAKLREGAQKSPRPPTNDQALPALATS